MFADLLILDILVQTPAGIRVNATRSRRGRCSGRTAAISWSLQQTRSPGSSRPAARPGRVGLSWSLNPSTRPRLE
jgi:hypothetical protein